MQCTFRGFHVRRSLQAALDSAKYVDTSLDDLAPIDFDSFMPPPPQLESNWDVPMTTTTSTPLTRHTPQPAACPPPSAALPSPHPPSSAAASGPFSPCAPRPSSSSSSHARLQPLYPSSMSHSPKALSEPNEGPHPPQPKPQTMLQEWGITVRTAHDSYPVIRLVHTSTSLLIELLDMGSAEI